MDASYRRNHDEERKQLSAQSAGAKQQDTERSAESRAEPDGKAPSSQVISVRLPASLADDVSEMAAQRGLRSSDLVKVAVEEYIRQTGIAAIRANTTGNLKVGPEITSFNSENSNPVEYPADVEIRMAMDTSPRTFTAWQRL